MSKRYATIEKTGQRFKFISCRPSADVWTSEYRHLAPVDSEGALLSWTTSLCGSTGNAEAWHGAITRPMCSGCLEKFVSMGGDRGAWL